jgi:hypothetical protein
MCCLSYNLRVACSGNGMTPALAKWIELQAKSFEGLKMRSKCRSYDVPQTTCKVLDSDDLKVHQPFVYV